MNRCWDATFGSEFGVFDFLEPLKTNFGQPEFEGFRLGRWDGLDEAVQLFRISDIGQTLLAVGSGHFQTVTIPHGLIPLFFQAFFQLPPIGSGIDALREDGDDIHDGENPFLFGLIPGAEDMFFFKEGDGAHEIWRERTSWSHLAGRRRMPMAGGRNLRPPLAFLSAVGWKAEIRESHGAGQEKLLQLVGGPPGGRKVNRMGA